MKKHLILVSLVALLAGCATQSDLTLRRGKLIRREAPAQPAARPAKPAPAPTATKPTPAPQPPPAPTPAPTPPPPPPPAPTPAPVPPPPPPPPPAPEPAPVTPAAVLIPATPTEEQPLVAARAGGLVQVRWLLPHSDIPYRAIEIMRNDRADPAGRSRVRAVRATVTQLEDTVPDAQADYWYWLKLTRDDGQIRNIGPVPAPRN